MKKFSLIFLLALAIVGGACLTALAADVIVTVKMYESDSKDGPFSSYSCFVIYDDGTFEAYTQPSDPWNPLPSPPSIGGIWEVWRDVAILKGGTWGWTPQDPPRSTWVISLNTLRGLVTRLSVGVEDSVLETGYVYAELLSPSEACEPNP